MRSSPGRPGIAELVGPDRGHGALDGVHRTTLAGVSRRGGQKRAYRPDEGIGGVEPVEQGCQAVEPGRGGGLRPDPRRQPEPMAQPPHGGEHLEGPGIAALGNLETDGVLEIREVALDVLAPEERASRGAASLEELRRQLEGEEMPGREAKAGVVLGHAVEGAHPGGREDAEQTVAEGIDHVRVAQLPAHLREERRRVPEQSRAGAHPWQPAGYPRGRWLDRGAPGTITTRPPARRRTAPDR